MSSFFFSFSMEKEMFRLVALIYVGLKPSSQYDADLGVMSGASTSGVNERSGRPFIIQHSQCSATMQSIKTTKTKI